MSATSPATDPEPPSTTAVGVAVAVAEAPTSPQKGVATSTAPGPAPGPVAAPAPSPAPAPAPAPVAAPAPPAARSPPPRSPLGYSPSWGKSSPEKRRALGAAPAPAASDGGAAAGDAGSGASSHRAAAATALNQGQGQTSAGTRRSRADLPIGPIRTSPSNSPPPRSLAYSGLVPALMPSGAVAGVAGPGGGALSGVYLGALGFGGWGSSSGGNNGGAQQQPMNPLSLPPVSPASATSSGRFVVGVSPASASSSHQRGMFSMGSSAASGSELVYSPSPSSGGREVSFQSRGAEVKHRLWGWEQVMRSQSRCELFFVHVNVQGEPLPR